MPASKQFFAKVYDQTGVTVLKNLAFDAPQDGSISVKAPPTFTARVNGGLGELILDLKTSWDSFSEGSTVDFMNVVDLYCVRIDSTTLTQTSRRIYRGYVSAYEPYLEDGDEGVRVTVLGLGSLLTKSYYGSPTAFTVTQAGADPRAIAQAICDHFNTVFGGSLISYSGSSMPSSVGTSVTKTYTQRTWWDALNDTKDLAGTGWYWKVDADGVLHLRSRPVTPTHRFTMNKDVATITAPKSAESVKNEVIVTRTGGTASSYTDATSQTTFGTGSPATGKYTEIINDPDIANVATADQRGNKFLNDNSSAKVKATLTIDGDAFDIESIKPGDTCQVTNFNGASTFFGSNNLFIASVKYEPDRVTLELEERPANFAGELSSFVGGSSVSGSSGASGVTSITGTANQVVASSGTGAVVLSLPQNIHTAATPTFAGLTLNGASGNTLVVDTSTLVVDASNNRVGIGTASPGVTLDVNGPIRNNNYVSANTTLAGGWLNVNTTDTSPAFIAYDGGAEIFRIADGGGVGVGTTSPTKRFQVGDNGCLVSLAGASEIASGYGALWFQATPSSTNYALTQTNGGDLFVNTPSGRAMYFRVGNAIDALYVKSDGNVGVGTVSPLSPLQVHSASGTQLTAAITDAGGKSGLLTITGLNGGNVGEGGGILFGGNTEDNFFAAIKSLLQSSGGNTIGDLAFATRNATSDTALTERLRITFGGNVGVGTGATVNAKLEVASGNLRLSDGYTLEWGSANNRIYNSSNTFALDVNAVTRLQVNSTGNVGVNTAPTVNYQLLVGGTTPSQSVYASLWFSQTHPGGGEQYGVGGIPTISATTTNAYAFYGGIDTAAAAITVTNLYGLYVANRTKGAGSTVTNQYGVYIENITNGTTSYALYSAGGACYLGGSLDVRGAVVVNETGAAVDVRIEGDTQTSLFKTDGTNDEVYLGGWTGFAEYDNGNSGTSKTLDFGLGNKQKLTLTGNCTLTFTAPASQGNFVLRLVQDATGSRLATWPASVKWPSGAAPTLSTGANAVDIVSGYFDGTSYFCQASLNFS